MTQETVRKTDLATLENTAITPAQYQEVLRSAHEKAKLLSGIVEDQRLYTDISGRKHLQYEAWITLAQGYGYDADIEWTKPVEGGGWEARAVVRNPRGEEVGHAEAECGTSGDANWIEKPSFQQRSMAQTRALSKALAAKLRWVVVLAGYSPTPVEEMEARSTETAGEIYPGIEAWIKGGENGLGICPEHHKPFFQSEKMREPAHKDGNSWCNQTTVLTPRFAELLEERVVANGLNPKADREIINNGIKSRYKGATWSQLSPVQKMDYLETLVPVEQDAPGGSSEATAPVEMG